MESSAFGPADAELSGWRDPLARLRAAIQRDEFALYCQPVLALRGPSSYPIAEVLVRLREEERAMLPPGEFLPVLEHYQMMPQLDRWVVRQVVKHLKAGSGVPCLAVNVAGQTIDDPAFPRFVAEALEANGLGPESLLFEVDELDTLTRLSSVQSFAEAVQRLGIGIVLDGFGRKSVSFHAVKLLRARYIKVDGSIVRKVLTSGLAGTKLNAILRVAEASGMELIAECVEDQDVLLRLRAIGVHMAQGFGIYPPHPIESFAGPPKV